MCLLSHCFYMLSQLLPGGFVIKTRSTGLKGFMAICKTHRMTLTDSWNHKFHWLHRYTDCGSKSELLFIQQRGQAAVPPLSLRCFSHWPSSWQLQVVQTDKNWWSWLGDTVRDIPAARPDPSYASSHGLGFSHCWDFLTLILTLRPA